VDHLDLYPDSVWTDGPAVFYVTPGLTLGTFHVQHGSPV